MCRRAALPVRTLPPAGSARHSALLFHPCALRPSAWSLSRPSARMSTPPNGFVFRTTTPRDQFRPRAGTRAKQTRASRHPMFLTAPQAFSHTLCASRFAVALQRMKPPLILVLHPNRRSPPMADFMPGGRAPAVLPFLLPSRAFSVRLPGLCVGLLRGERCPGLSRFASPPPREDKGRRSVVRGEAGKNRVFRSKSRQNAMRTGQKHNKIKHVENIEKADVSCETMQNSPKSKRRKRTVGVGSRSRKARLSGGRKSVCCGKKERLGVRPERLCAPARGGEQGKHLKKGSPAEEQGRF